MEIYEPQGRAREYSPLALNYFKGCDHGCLYCYVPTMMVRFNAKYAHQNVFSSPDYIKIEKSAKKMQGCGKQILFSFTTDPYTKQNVNQTMKVLEILNKYNHKVAILTKGGKRVLRDIETFIAFGDRIKIGASLTFDNNEDTQEWEHGSAMPKDRVESLSFLASQGIKTWASFEPVIKPEQSLNLLRQVSTFIDHVKIGKINNYKGIDKTIDWAKFLEDSVKILRDANMNDRFYIKKDLLAFNKGVYLSKNETNEDYLNL